MIFTSCSISIDRTQKEISKHSSSSYPIACFEEDLNEEKVPWHWHDDWEIICIHKGNCRISVSDKVIELNENQGVLINTGMIHSLEPMGPLSLIHSVVFHPRLIASRDTIYWTKLVSPLFEKDVCPYFRLNTTQIEQVDRVWQFTKEEYEDYEIDVRYELSKFLKTVVAELPKINQTMSAQEARDNQRLKTMLMYIQMNYENPITVSEIAKSADISESECLRCFKKMLGMAPSAYIKEYRIQKAKELLLESQLSIGEIGFQCGYLDTSYFTKVFKESVGVTPKRFRMRT